VPSSLHALSNDGMGARNSPDVRGFKEWDALLRQIYPIDTARHRATPPATRDEAPKERDDDAHDSAGRAA
jgi:hypothetical protein